MVAIKNMEIPKSCYECDIDMGECPIEKYQLWLIDYQDKRHKDCPLIEIEQSDDCVSRQSMLDAITEIDENINMDIYTNEVREIVKELPPVTPKLSTSDDCVSREQAVKAITDWYIDMLENGEGKDPINVLDALPPVIPTHDKSKEDITEDVF